MPVPSSEALTSGFARVEEPGIRRTVSDRDTPRLPNPPKNQEICCVGVLVEHDSPLELARIDLVVRILEPQAGSLRDRAGLINYEEQKTVLVARQVERRHVRFSYLVIPYLSSIEKAMKDILTTEFADHIR